MPPAKRAAAKPAATKPAAPPAATPANSSPEDGLPRGAAAKLAYVQGHVTNVDKSGWHPQQKFKYIEEHGVFDVIRPLIRLLKFSVVVECATEVRVDNGIPFGKQGSPAALATLTGTLTFTDSEAPCFVDRGDGVYVENPDRVITARYSGQGIDTQDKAVGKAQTYLSKYAHQKFFLIPTEAIDDSDVDVAGEEQAAAVTGSAPAATPPEQAQDPAATGTATGVETGEIVNPETAKQLVATITEFVKGGQLDGNKVKAKLGTYRTDQVGNLTAVQFDEFRTWLNQQVQAAGG